MIISSLNNCDDEKKYLNISIQNALETLKTINTEASGRITIDGENLYINIVETDTNLYDQVKAESHKSYIDIHYLISGEEYIGYGIKTNKQKVSQDLLKESDALLYDEVENEVFLHQLPGMFAIFFPNDIHRPGCCIKDRTKIKKAIIKLKIN